MVISPKFWRGKSVFLTGHTGFKGSWLTAWLNDAGAAVHGFALTPPTHPSMFEICGLAERLASHTIGDIRNAGALSGAMIAAQPDIVIHMAAQPLVRASYVQPVETYAVNVMGTVNVLEAARQLDTVQALVCVTTDKCYENREWLWGYRESEALGGHDPYSSSKACAELVTAAYRRSFHEEGRPWIGSGRAGNVIGGGDWAADRLIPDVLRAADAGEELVIRSPGAIRPWQHVLEPVVGYLLLAERLATAGKRYAAAWNFGPADQDARPVSWILDHLCHLVPGLRWRTGSAHQPHEAGFLKLDSSAARSQLGWTPRWTLKTALEETVAWHSNWKAGADMHAFTLRQIASYSGGFDE